MSRRHWWSREPVASEKPSSDPGQAAPGRRPKALRPDASRIGDRARAALGLDRELRAASPQVIARGVAPSEPFSSGHDTRGSRECADRIGPHPDEPIRTRTMARLYAQQGLEERALRIYEYLLEKEPDAELAREAAALAALVKSK